MSELKSKDEQIKFLWGLLDDISTAGDAFKPEHTAYYNYVNRKCDERSAVANSFDGYSITIKSVETKGDIK